MSNPTPNLLRPAVNTTAYLKIGSMGFEGSGKTHTAILIALGLCKLLGKKKIAFFDTEKGSDFHIKRVEAEGCKLMVIKSRAFKDLLAVIKEVEASGEYGALLIDSVTHVWRELTESFLATKKKRIQSYQRNTDKNIQVNLAMKDWNILKGEWAQFSDLFVNSKAHIIACGRAGFEYDVTEDEEGKQEIMKSGTKMKAEGEFGYESDLLIEMERVRLPPPGKGKRAPKGFINRLTVLKDRTNLLNGKSFDNPTFKTIEPIVKELNIGGNHEGVDTRRNSQDIFGDPDFSLKERELRHNLAIEALNEALILCGLSGTGKAETTGRTKALRECFGTSGKLAIEQLPTDVIIQNTAKLVDSYGPAELKAQAVPEDKHSAPPKVNHDAEIEF